MDMSMGMGGKKTDEQSRQDRTLLILFPKIR